jgi:ADP-ribose pyrophosphatase YjhB (NUDIX family)
MPHVKLPITAQVVLLQTGKLLLVRRYGTGFEDGNLGLVGGHVESGESVTQAAIRECWEEVGIEIAPRDLYPIGVSNYTSPGGDGIDFFFKATSWAGDLYPRSECSELVWCEPARLPSTTIPFVRQAIEKHLEASCWFDETGWDNDLR